MIVIKIIVCQNIKDIWLHYIPSVFSLYIVALKKKKLEFESVYMYIFLINICFVFRIFFVRDDFCMIKYNIFFALSL